MGLTLCVGILADLAANDEEGAEVFAGYFAELDRCLAARSLPPHHEPQDGEGWGADMLGYASLHYLRRIAAHLDAGRPLPPPGDRDSAGDPMIAAYGTAVAGGQPGRLARWLGRGPRFARRFDHLLLHSDAEGFYLPADFAEVIVTRGSSDLPGGEVGSVPRLLDECERLAVALEIPDDLDPEDDTLAEATQSQGLGRTTWQRYAYESHACVALREGCRAALRSGAALVFS